MAGISGSVRCLFAFSLLLFTVPVPSVAVPHFAIQDGKFAVGDIVEFKFLGDMIEGEVTGFTGTGWPTIQFDHNGRATERPYPPSRLTLVESAAEAADAEMTGGGELRDWTDATGTFNIKAKLLSNKNGKVELQKEDGRVVTLPAIKLSESDQAYLKEFEKQNSEENPFAGGELKSTPTTTDARRTNRMERSPTPGKSTPAITPDASSNERVLTASKWNFQPDAAVSMASNNKVIGIDSGFTKHKFHNRLGGTSLTVDKRLLATVMSNPFENASEIIVADLETGKSGPALRIAPKEASLLAVSPDGSRVVTFKNGRGREPGSMDFWKLGETAKHESAWNTASFFDRGGLAPSSGLFLDESRLLTFGRRVILWDCETAAALFSFSVAESTKPALSPNGKRIAIASGDSVYLVDSGDGKTMGAFVPPSASNVMAFSNDGRFLAGLAAESGAIWVWDLRNNELVRQLSSPQTGSQSMHWVGDKYLLVGGTNLIDVELRTVVWKYRMVGSSILSGDDGRFWLAGTSKIVPVSLPHKNIDQETAHFDPDELLVLKPGAKVSIKLELPFPPAEQKEIRNHLVSMLKSNGVTVDNSADLELNLSVTKGKQETAEMSSFMDPFGRRGTETIKYSPNNANIVLNNGDVELWGKGRRFGPGGMITMKRDETAQQAADRLCQPNSDYFKSVKLPKYFSQFPNGKPLGESRISEQGVQ